MDDALATVSWPVRTERLTLRRAAPDDAEAVWTVRSQPGVDDYLARATGDLGGFAERFASRLDAAVIVELNGEVIGDLLVTIGDAWAQAEVEETAKGTEAELGWVLDPRRGGRGLATEAVDALLGLCFGPIGLRRVTAYCFADNTRSWRMMERLGMRREIIGRQDSLHRSGRWCDSFGYAMLADEWRARG